MIRTRPRFTISKTRIRWYRLSMAVLFAVSGIAQRPRKLGYPTRPFWEWRYSYRWTSFHAAWQDQPWVTNEPCTSHDNAPVKILLRAWQSRCYSLRVLTKVFVNRGEPMPIPGMIIQMSRRESAGDQVACTRENASCWPRKRASPVAKCLLVVISRFARCIAISAVILFFVFFFFPRLVLGGWFMGTRRFLDADWLFLLWIFAIW